MRTSVITRVGLPVMALTLAVSPLALGSSCGDKHNIADTAKEAGSFNTLLAAAKAAGMIDALTGEGPLTVFAPTDEAFAKLPKGTVDGLLKDPVKLRAILKYHVVDGAVDSKAVSKLSSAKTMLGQPVTVSTTNGVRINNASVVKADIACSNGMIHVIDTVLLPKDDLVDVATKAGSFKTLLAALEAAGLTDAVRSGDITVFAPTDEAFARLPEGTVESLLKDLPKLRSILKYHVLTKPVMSSQAAKLNSAESMLGQTLTIDTADGVRINNARVAKADITAPGCKGVIHVVDAVLLPKDDIIDVARKAGSFKTLSAAIEAAGLSDALRDKGPFTVFAPTDEAFARLPEGTVEALLKDAPKLKSILLYHVVPGKVTSDAVVNLSSAKTLQGEKITIASRNGVKVNQANVIKVDVQAANGVIHVIDSVILPSGKAEEVSANR